MRTDVVGWIEAIAVASSYQRQGIGRALLRWAEEWLASQNNGQGDSDACASGSRAETELSANLRVKGRIQVGGGLRPFAPGPLADSAGEAFFLASGYEYADGPFGWDVARSLSDYQSPPLREAPAAARPGQRGQEAELLSFLAKEFPGRWHWQAERFLEEGGRISDYMLLWTQEGVQGSCRLTFEDSVNPIDRFFPYGLPRPWAQLGSIGVSAHLRGVGNGAALAGCGTEAVAQQRHQRLCDRLDDAARLLRKVRIPPLSKVGPARAESRRHGGWRQSGIRSPAGGKRLTGDWHESHWIDERHFRRRHRRGGGGNSGHG